MKRLLISLSIFMLFSCAGQIKQVPLKMADISDKLATLDSKPDMNFVSKAKISYPKIDIQRFDEFFKKAAEIRGTIVVAKGLLEYEKDLLSNLGRELQISNTTDLNH